MFDAWMVGLLLLLTLLFLLLSFGGASGREDKESKPEIRKAIVVDSATSGQRAEFLNAPEEKEN